MKPLFVLCGTFVISLLAFIAVYGYMNFGMSGRIAMSAMLVFTGIGHFAYSKGMQMMLPDFIRSRRLVVISTGIIEFLAAIGLLIPGTQKITAWLLILFFIVILPANIYAARNNVDYQHAGYDGPGPAYLWLRIPMQVFFILWVLWFGILMSPLKVF